MTNLKFLSMIQTARQSFARIVCAFFSFSAALWLASAGPSTALDLADLSPEEKQAFGLLVRDYLLENPEILIELIQRIEQRSTEQQNISDAERIRTNSEELFNSGDSWVGGNLEGDVTFVEFLDYRCGFCRGAYPDVEQLVESDGNIRFVVKEFPILGEDSARSARLALAALQLSGRPAYKQVHDELIGLSGPVTQNVVEYLAEMIGIDSAELSAHAASDEVSSVIESSYRLATALGIDGTPAFIFGDQIFRGKLTLAEMQEIVALVRSNPN